MRNKKSDWIEVGSIYVDAGIVMVGDPCYTQGDDASSHVSSWNEWLEKTYPTMFGPNATDHKGPNFADALGQKGLGIVVSAGFGDGEYPVYIKISDEGEWGQRVAELRVVFIEDEGSPDWNSEEYRQ